MAWGPFRALNEDAAFREKLKEAYETEFRPVITRFLPEAMSTYEQQISASHAMDRMRWEGDYISPYGTYAGSLAGSVDLMRTWVEQRLDCFDSVFTGGSDLVRVTLLPNCEDLEQEVLYYVKGSQFGQKRPRREGYTFAGWYTQDGQPVDLTAPITEDMVLEARWEAEVPVAVPGTGEDSETPEVPASTSGKSWFDKGIVLCLAVICLYIFLCLVSDILGQIFKKRKKHEDRTSVPS